MKIYSNQKDSRGHEVVGFQDWKLKLYAALSNLNPLALKICRESESHVDPIPMSQDASESEIQRSLFNILLQITDGTVLDEIKYTEEMNGAEAWRKLNKVFDPKTRQRKIVLARACVNPGQVKSADSYHSHVQGWENNMRVYNDKYGTVVPDDLKVSLLLEMCPSSWTSAIIAQMTDDWDFSRTKDAIWTLISRNVSGPVPMELGAVEKEPGAQEEVQEDWQSQWWYGGELDAMGKGKGKYGKKGQPFAGTCWECGQTGHRASQCPNRQRTNVTCWVCGEKGHIHTACPYAVGKGGGQQALQQSSYDKGKGKGGKGKGKGKFGKGKGWLSEMSGEQQQQQPPQQQQQQQQQQPPPSAWDSWSAPTQSVPALFSLTPARKTVKRREFAEACRSPCCNATPTSTFAALPITGHDDDDDDGYNKVTYDEYENIVIEEDVPTVVTKRMVRRRREKEAKMGRLIEKDRKNHMVEDHVLTVVNETTGLVEEIPLVDSDDEEAEPLPSEKCEFDDFDHDDSDDDEKTKAIDESIAKLAAMLKDAETTKSIDQSILKLTALLEETGAIEPVDQPPGLHRQPDPGASFNDHSSESFGIIGAVGNIGATLRPRD